MKKTVEIVIFDGVRMKSVTIIPAFQKICDSIIKVDFYFLFLFHFLAIRKHYTVASYKLMCWQLGQ